MAWSIEGGAVLGADGLNPSTLALAQMRVAAAAPAGAKRLDATGCWVLPGIVDIHGDAHERALQPRPGVGFAADFALRDTAAQLLGAGITTAYLGLTLSWEPGLRSVEMFRALLAAPAPGGPDIRVHLRFEADNLGALDDALQAIAKGQVHLLGYNDHTPGIAKKVTDPMQLAKYAGRAGVSDADFRALVDTAMASRPGVAAARAALAAAAQAAAIPMLSHDDPHIEQRAAFRALGASICWARPMWCAAAAIWAGPQPRRWPSAASSPCWPVITIGPHFSQRPSSCCAAACWMWPRPGHWSRPIQPKRWA
ncbi:MAG: hypothetical protein EBX37_15965 [Alphaproteobacteria bacterium]|nr:hypothetical protein [Alphaproteobacteria bacterium]